MKIAAQEILNSNVRSLQHLAIAVSGAAQYMEVVRKLRTNWNLKEVLHNSATVEDFLKIDPIDLYAKGILLNALLTH